MRVTAVEALCVVAEDDLARNLASNLARGLPRCVPLPERAGQLAIVGSGPSVRDYLDELRGWVGEIWATNGSYNYLLDHGIVPHGFLAVDPLPGLCDYLHNARSGATFYVSGLVDPSTLDALEGHDVKLWFLVHDCVKYPAGLWLVSGGTTGLLRAPFLAHMLGWRDMTIYGADSSFEGNRYVYPDGSYQWDSKAPVNWVRTTNGEGPFATEICLLKQVSQFGCILPHFKGNLKIRCGGLLDAYLRSPMSDEGLIDALDESCDVMAQIKVGEEWEKI